MLLCTGEKRKMIEKERESIALPEFRKKQRPSTNNEKPKSVRVVYNFGTARSGTTVLTFPTTSTTRPH